MKKFLILAIFLFTVAVSASGQECPADKVCISPQAARKAIADAETVKAQEAQIKGLEQAVKDEKDVAEKLKIEYAEARGELTALKQNAVSDRAIIELLLKNSKKKCYPFSILCL